MIDYLSKERLGIMLTTRCTLKCRGCYLMIPEQKPWDADIETVKASLPKIFEVFDHFEQICLMGGEPFLYRHIPEVLEALGAFKSRFGFVRIVTNATVIPAQDVLDALRDVDYHADVRISDYGENSWKYQEMVDILKKNAIHTTIVHYTDEEQYHGGWVEFGVNWAYRDYSPKRLQELYDNCNYKTFFNWGRYVYRCPTVSGAVQMGKLTVPDEEKIDLFSDESVESKKAKVVKLINAPQDACRYCDSFDAENGVRFKAGEQIEKKKLKSCEQLICQSLSIHTTSACTLKCAKCGWSFPHYPVCIAADIDKTIYALEKVFQVYDFVKEVRYGGAEAFLYPHLERLMEAVSSYRSKFDYAIIVTNGTYVPRQKIIETMKRLPYRLVVRVDNYGALSGKYSEVVSVLRDNNIEVDERQYCGKEQAYGGWIDLGDYTDKHYSDEQVAKIYYRCRVPDDCTILLDDRLTICSYAFSGALIGKVPNARREVVNLSGSESIRELRVAVKSWRDAPLNACRYCNGCDPVNSPRIPAAEQIVKFTTGGKQ